MENAKVGCDINSFMFAEVHLLDIPYAADKAYSYSIPPELRGKVFPGTPVIVPFGRANNRKSGIVVRIFQNSEIRNLKEIYASHTDDFCLCPDLVALCLHMKETLFCTVGEAAKAMLPPGLDFESVTRYKYVGNTVHGNAPQNNKTELEAEIEEYIKSNSPCFDDIKREFSKMTEELSISELVKKAIKEKRIKTFDDLKFSINTKVEKQVLLALSEKELDLALCADNKTFSDVQKEVLSIVSECPPLTRSKLSQVYGISVSTINTLIKKKALALCDVRVNRTPYAFVSNEQAQYGVQDIALSDEQQAAFSELSELYSSKDAKAALLFGVTGSGKTQVILKLTDKCISDGKDVIVLVPEIALTSQTVNIFIKRYGERVSVIHSALSDGERTDAWRKIKSGCGNIVIGTRSAIFAPVKNLGMIVLDEEQESSFKADMNPKYHARDIARYRCAFSKAFMLLASATPSLESFTKAKNGIYSLVKLCSRYGNAVLPTVSVSDLRENGESSADKAEVVSIKSRLIGNELFASLSECLEKGEQAVLLLNKRGYNSLVTCRVCGYTAECPNCSVAMTHHKHDYGSGGRLVCHYCGYSSAIPQVCPSCGASHIGFVGTGIQMLEEELCERLPSARVLRMDLDTTSGKMGHDKILDSFRNGEADILVGTQMVAKGHDFGRVSLVGIVLADTSLYVGDFRASERTFSLVTQVIGRAGRGDIPGKAVIQTYSPENEVLTLASAQDYESFYEGEAALRSATSFPPFCDIVTVTFTSETENDVIRASTAFGKSFDDIARQSFPDVKMIVYGPFKAGIYKVLGKYRMKYIIKCKNSKRLRELLSTAYTEFLTNSKGKTSVSLDINPTSML